MTSLRISARSLSCLTLVLGCLGSFGCARTDQDPEVGVQPATRTTAVTTAQATATTPAVAPSAPAAPKPAPAVGPAALGAAASDPTKNEPAGLGASAAHPLVLKRLVVASDVKDREPVALEGASPKEPVVAFLEFQNPSASEFDVLVTFEHESGERVGFIELRVPAAMQRFRTWGRTRNIKQAGTWTAIVTGDAGQELARQTFTVS